jgi:hypothetical protein
MLVMVVIIGMHGPLWRVVTPEEFFFYFSIYSLWLANLWMILAPAMAKRLREGKGQLFLFTAWLWILVPIPIAIKAYTHHSDIGGTKITTGFYVWWSSLLFMALVCTALHLRSRPNHLEPYPPPRS